MISPCQHCAEVRTHLIERMDTSAFGKIVQQCSECGVLWAISRTHKEPYEVITDERAKPPKGNRLAFVNDPRRRRPH